jgi:hypothetical protein
VEFGAQVHMVGVGAAHKSHGKGGGGGEEGVEGAW